MNTYELKFMTSWRKISYKCYYFASLLQVVFFPSSPEVSQEIYTIVCDNCQVNDVTVTGLFLRLSRDHVSNTADTQLM